MNVLQAKNNLTIIIKKMLYLTTNDSRLHLHTVRLRCCFGWSTSLRVLEWFWLELSFVIMYLVKNELFEFKKCKNLKYIRKKNINMDIVLFISKFHEILKINYLISIWNNKVINFKVWGLVWYSSLTPIKLYFFISILSFSENL